MGLSVCITCDGGADLADALDAVLEAPVSRVECMNVCTRPACLSLRAPGKVAYLFGDVTRADAPNVPTLLALYDSTKDGIIEDARALGDLRMKLIGRIPA